MSSIPVSSDIINTVTVVSTIVSLEILLKPKVVSYSTSKPLGTSTKNSSPLSLTVCSPKNVESAITESLTALTNVTAFLPSGWYEPVRILWKFSTLYTVCIRKRLSSLYISSSSQIKLGI